MLRVYDVQALKDRPLLIFCEQLFNGLVHLRYKNSQGCMLKRVKELFTKKRVADNPLVPQSDIHILLIAGFTDMIWATKIGS